jgi:hypothetical protein
MSLFIKSIKMKTYTLCCLNYTSQIQVIGLLIDVAKLFDYGDLAYDAVIIDSAPFHAGSPDALLIE